jgi:pimeloyl-ACP methyl ester carboxylesterase
MEEQLSQIGYFCKSNNVSLQNILFTKNDFLTYFKTHENKKTIVLVHGLHSDMFFPFVELIFILLKKGYSVVTFDLPGHGKNKKKFLLNSCVNTLSEVVHFLKTKMKIPKKDLILVGHSMGAFLSLLESTNNSISGVVAISPPYKVRPKSFVFLEFLSILSPNFLRQIKYYSFSTFFSSNFLKKKRYSKEKLKNMTEEAESVADGILEKIKHSNVPLLHIHGRLDLFVPFWQARDISSNYGGKITEYFPFFSNHIIILFKKKTLKKILEMIEKN